MTDSQRDLPEDIKVIRNRLPKDLNKILNRRSSKDKESTFLYKVQMLIKFLLTNNDLESDIGLKLHPGQNLFEINKKVFASFMGIKVNSLNHNLRDRGFDYVIKNGAWTTYTHNSIEIPTEIDQHPPEKNEELPKDVGVLITNPPFNTNANETRYIKKPFVIPPITMHHAEIYQHSDTNEELPKDSGPQITESLFNTEITNSSDTAITNSSDTENNVVELLIEELNEISY